MCLSDDDGLIHIGTLLKSNYTAKDMGTLGFEDSDVESLLLLLDRVSRVGKDQIGQYLYIELDLRHAPLIISESGCNANTKTARTPREKLQDKLVLDGRRSPILNRDDATKYRSACMRLSYLAQDRLDLAETAKHLAQRMSEPREFDFVPLKRAARYLVEYMLTRSQSSWTATLLATQSRGRARLDWWLSLVTTLWNLDRRCRA